MVLTASKLAEILGFESNDGAYLSVLLTDSRALLYPSETVFFALRTPGNDGHKFVSELVKKGVRYFVVDRDFDVSAFPEATFWKVESPLESLQKVGSAVRRMFPNIPVIGVTGSRGKTVVKELIYDLLKDKMNVARSPRSYNSQIGVPLSLWTLTPETEVAIIEAGISQKGEMRAIEEMIKPTIGVITCLTSEHEQGFESLEQKAKEKVELLKDCNDVFYLESEAIVAEALTSINAALHPVKGGNEELALAVASFVYGESLSIETIRGKGALISPRIDMTETLKNCLVIYDGFGSDIMSIAEAINYARRHAADRKITLVLGNSDDIDQAALGKLLDAVGIERLIAVNSPQEFLDNFSISDFSDEVILVSGPVADGYEDVKVMLEAPRHETVMEVDLGAIARNFNYFRSLLPQKTGLIAMVKAQGYGVGALELSKTLQNQGASYLAVAVIDEGVELRRGGVTMPIIVMNPVTTNYKALFDNQLQPSVFSLRELNVLLENARRWGIKDYPVHIKLDTGMHRLGFLEEEIPQLLEVLNNQDYVKVATIFSHLATADCLDEDAYTSSQLEAFDRMSSKIKSGLGYPVKRHVLNTAGIMRYTKYHYDFARLGIGLYGVSPLPTDKDKLEVVAQLFTTIISIKHWDKGTTIGYGRKGKITGPSEIATIPIGYADGLDRHFSNGGASFIVNGHECPVVGNICMDQCMIDVTGADAKIGDKVEIFGRKAPLERLSAALQTIPYEILTSVSPRVKRIYFRE